MVKAIEWKDGRVLMLDQRRLPNEVAYIDCTDYVMVAEGIRNLSIRGAPAIGIAAAMGIALGAQRIRAETFDDFCEQLDHVIQVILETRPTAVNIRWAANRMRTLLHSLRSEPIAEIKQRLIGESRRIHEEDIEVNRSIGKWGSALIRSGDNILTHCNAGSLATGGIGTATAPIYESWKQGKKIMVFADETRPVLQGARLTAYELKEEGIPATLITDGTAGTLMKKGLIDLAIVGTDRTTRNGDVANKIGTYTVAVLCREHGIPFYVAAPLSSIDFTLDSGDMIPIEQRNPEEVAVICGHRIAPEGIAIVNQAFDVTPARYVTGFITEKGIFRPSDLRKLADANTDTDALRVRP